MGALIVGKAILIVEKLPISRWFSTRLIYNIFWKTLLFGIVTMAFRFIEELIPLLREHEGFVVALRHLSEETSWALFWGVQMWLFNLLFMYCLAADIARTIGTGQVWTMLVESKQGESD